LQANDLAHPQAGAVAEDELGVERRRTKRCVRRGKLAGRAEQSPDLLGRIDVQAAVLAEHRLLQHPIERRRSRCTRVDLMQGSRQGPSDPDVLVLNCRRARLGGVGMHQSVKRLGFGPGPLLRKAVEAQERLLIALVPERAHSVDVVTQRRTEAAADYYLDEFTFRFNRRASRHRGWLFYHLLEQAVAVDPTPYAAMVRGIRGRGRRGSGR